MTIVRSFGTEDRETPYPIMPQTTVYDYILFRGSDIKDIRVVNNVAIANDPAIMQMHLPTQPNFQQNFPQQQPGGAPVMNQFGLPFSQMQGGNMGPPMGNMPQQQAQSPIQSHHQGNNNHNNIAPGSGHKNKKSSELSNSNNMACEKSAENTLTAVKPSAVRKQSNKSQGVHRTLCLSQFYS
jgi:protein LSM14